MHTPSLGILAALGASGIGAQQAPSQTIPIRQLAPPTATARDTIKTLGGLVQLPDGRVLVNDSGRRRPLVFDQSLATVTVTADSSSAYPRLAMGRLYGYVGDSSVILDMDAHALLIIGPDGRIDRAMAHPRPGDLMNVMLYPTGSPGVDARGRLIYRAGNQLCQPPPVRCAARTPHTRDTIAIVRADFDTRMVDTIASFTTPSGVSPAGPELVTTVDAKGKTQGTMHINPVPAATDDWAVLSDGSLAVIRGHDYHIDWVYADGTKASTPKMPFDWRRLTDANKQAKIDSMKKIIDSVNATGTPYGRLVRRLYNGADVRIDTVVPLVDFVPLSEISDYIPPIRLGTTKADRDGNLWILPTTSLNANGGLLYDVVSRRGEIVERVQLPANRDIAGFGPGGTVYLSWGDRGRGYLIERTSVVGRRGRQFP